MYTIDLPSGESNIDYRDLFYMAPAIYRFNMGIKYPNSPPIESSPVTNNLFVTTHEDHQHPPFTGQLYLICAHNIDLGSLSRSLKYLTLHGGQVFNLHNFHNDLSIALISYTKIDIEVLKSLFYLD